MLALVCVSCTVTALAQPAVGMAFPSALAGRALSAYNLVLFSGVFTVQWGIGLLLDGFKALGLAEVGEVPASETMACRMLSFAAPSGCCASEISSVVTTFSNCREVSSRVDRSVARRRASLPEY